MIDSDEQLQVDKLKNSIRKMNDNSLSAALPDFTESRNIFRDHAENQVEEYCTEDNNSDNSQNTINTNNGKIAVFSAKRERRQSRRYIFEENMMPETRPLSKRKNKKKMKEELKKNNILLKKRKQNETLSGMASSSFLVSSKKAKKNAISEELTEDQKYVYEGQRGLLEHPNPNLLDLSLFNRIFENHSSELKGISQGIIERKVYLHELSHEQKYSSKAMITCDLGLFDFAPLIQQFKSFDAIMVSPRESHEEWSAQQFINCQIEELSTHGFLFFWTGNLTLSSSYTVMSQWGYDVIEQIVWNKIDKTACVPSVSAQKLSPLLNSKELCLVGVKKQINSRTVEYVTKVANNVILAAASTSYAAAPDQIYNTIDLLMPGCKFIELFSKQLPLRTGWLGLKHQNALTRQNKDNDWAVGKKSRMIYDNLPIFRNKTCFVCGKSPLIGQYFTCNECATATKLEDYFNLCQECYFSQSPSQPTPGKHLPWHALSIITQNHLQIKTIIQCSNNSCTNLSASNEQTIRKCITCFELYLCNKCIIEPEKLHLPLAISRAHKISHEFVILKQGSYVPIENK